MMHSRQPGQFKSCQLGDWMDPERMGSCSSCTQDKRAPVRELRVGSYLARLCAMCLEELRVELAHADDEPGSPESDGDPTTGGRCVRCGIGIDHDGDGDCAICTRLTAVQLDELGWGRK